MSYYPDWRPPHLTAPTAAGNPIEDTQMRDTQVSTKKRGAMISRYYKAAIAFVGILGTSLGAIAADPDISGALPTGWAAAVVAAGTVVGTVLVILKRNEPTVEEAEAALERARNRAA